MTPCPLVHLFFNFEAKLFFFKWFQIVEKAAKYYIKMIKRHLAERKCCCSIDVEASLNVKEFLVFCSVGVVSFFDVSSLGLVSVFVASSLDHVLVTHTITHTRNSSL